MATDLGKVGIVMKGTWSSSATYEALDAVSYNNGLYIAKQAVPANTAPTNTTYWQIATDVSSKADKVASAVDGHLAALNSEGNLADSGRSISNIISLWNFSSYYTDVDFDELPYGVTHVIPGSGASHVPPATDSGWIVMTVGGKQGANTFAFQMAVGVTAGNVYLRRCWGSWGAWTDLAT